MFSGIVQKMGEIVELDLKEKWGRIAVKTDEWNPPIENGESIATSGICLTTTEYRNNTFSFDVLRETFEKTNLGERNVGDKVNLERSLKWGDPMGGHIVVGHVDGVGQVKTVEQVGRDWKYEFTCSQEILDGMVYKGSISIDGVSLTVAELCASSFWVHIIPFTYENTSFCQYREGTGVNLEVDLLAKYMRRLVERGKGYSGVTWKDLRETGLIDENRIPEE